MEISVCMPVYNGSKFIKRCIDSVLAQEFNNDFEFIIVDDGSEDNTVELIEEYNDPRIKLFKREHLGIVEASNFGIDQCTGKYIARMDADDVMLPNRLQLQYDFLESHPEFAACSGDTIVNNGKIKYRKLGKALEITHRMLMVAYPMTHSCFTYRRDLNLKYDKAYEWSEDLKLYLDMTNSGLRIWSLEEPLCEYFIHPEQITNRLANENKKQSMRARAAFKNFNRTSFFDLIKKKSE